MDFFGIVGIAVGLSMDAFAVAICKGLGMKRIDMRQALVIALFFGAFQGLMPVLGWALGTQFERFITPIDHWIAFALLAFIGGKMLWDALGSAACKSAGPDAAAVAADATSEASGAAVAADAASEASGVAPGAAVPLPDAPSCPSAKMDYRELLMLAIATSIDALAVGITFAFLQVNIALAASLIGVTTFVLSLAGVAIGNRFGARFERLATMAGGVVLVLIGLKILLEHLGVLVL